MAARQVRSLAQTLRLSSPHTQCVSSRVSHLNASRGFASEHHGPPKVNFWEDPMSPSKWKEEHGSLKFVSVDSSLFPQILGDVFFKWSQFVLISLAGWGALIYGSYKFFTGGKKDKSNEKAQEGSH